MVPTFLVLSETYRLILKIYYNFLTINIHKKLPNNEVNPEGVTSIIGSF